jgi:MOSC domain-containing protein YiiM
MTALFFQQAKPGWYASVIREGVFSAEDQIVLRRRDPEGVTVADVWLYSAQQSADDATRKRIGSIELLPEFWKQRIDRDSSS